MAGYSRVISLAPSNTEILHELGADDDVIATTALCDTPLADETPSVGGWTTPDVDAVAAHDPDLVLASDELQDEAVDRCEDAGLTVKQLTPTRLNDVFNTIKQIGELVGQEDTARAIVDDMNAAVADIAVQDDDRTRVYCEEWHDPPMAGGNWIPRMVRMVGGSYLLEEGERSRAVSQDEILSFDPEHVFLHYCGFGDAAEEDQVLERDSWAELSAVQQGNVHVIDDTLLNRPGPRLVEGMKEMKARIHGSEQSRM